MLQIDRRVTRVAMRAHRFVAALLWLLCACSDDAPPVGASGSGGAAGGPGTGAGGAGGAEPEASVVVVVLNLNPLSPETLPADGAVVAIEWPDGAFDEGITDTTGRVALPRRGPLGTPIHVTAFKEGLNLRSRVSYPVATEEIPMRLATLPPFVPLSGTAAAMADPQNSLLVSVVTGGVAVGFGPIWNTVGWAGIPLTLVAAEVAPSAVPVSPRGSAATFVGWTIAESPALSRAAEIAIDFAEPATPAVWSGSFPVPAGEGLLAKFGTGSACPIAIVGRTYQCVGRPRYIDVTSDGSAFAFEVEYVDAAGGAGSDTIGDALIALGAGQISSQVFVQGPLVDGPQSIEIPEGVVVISPVGNGSHPLHDSVAWNADPTHAGMVFDLAIAPKAGVRWLIRSEPGATTLQVPRLPSAVDVAALLGPSPLARVEGCRLDNQGSVCVASTISRGFTLELP
jgi:hypothetical protein